MDLQQQKLDSLWQAVEDAKLRLDLAHHSANLARQDRMEGAMAPSDGAYAHSRALRAEVSTAKEYWQALDHFIAHVDQIPIGASKQQHGLTSREREVLKLIVAGKSSRQIAAHLGIAFKTAVAHRYHLHQKLKVHKSVDLARVAITMGLIQS